MLKIKNYKQTLEYRIKSLDALKIICQNWCINDESDEYKEGVRQIIETSADWYEICRGLNVPTCDQYYKGIGAVQTLVSNLNDVVNQIKASLLAAKITRVYVHDTDNFVNKTEDSIGEMTLNEFQTKLNQKIRACSSKVSVRACELRKIMVYDKVITELNHDVKSMCKKFIENHRIPPKLLSVPPESVPAPTPAPIHKYNVNLNTSSYKDLDIDHQNIQAAGTKTRNKRRRTRNKKHNNSRRRQ
jgi:DNA-directed RNA polymerase beta subunit|uniref:Uncharacterized protein n=1 Tax=viral metagenome TaxID=1070528 RepID=A0A6C0M4B3_9ZZZZ